MLTRLMLVVSVGCALWSFGSGLYLWGKAQLAQYLLERAWQQTRQDGRAGINSTYAPWPWADSRPLVKLSMPRLNQEFIVLAGSSGRNLAFAPAHVSGSALPGEVGVSVIGGHRDTHFASLRYLKMGDRLTLSKANGRVQRFRVTGFQVVDSRRTELLLEADRPVLALVACYPFDAISAGGPLRYLVFAEPESLEVDEPINAELLSLPKVITGSRTFQSVRPMMM